MTKWAYSSASYVVYRLTAGRDVRGIDLGGCSLLPGDICMEVYVLEEDV